MSQKDHDAVALAALIHASRKRLGLTQRQFARKIGVSQQTLSTWERGEHLGSVFTAWRLADLLLSR